MKVFISHSSEDKDAFVRPLVLKLREHGLDVWFDELVLRAGDSLRESIERGLAACDYGIVVISKSFLCKQWPQQELNGLFGRDLESKRRLLIPIWLGISAEEVRKVAPILADRYSLQASMGLDAIVAHVLQVAGDDERDLRPERKTSNVISYSHRYYKIPADIPSFGYQLNSGPFSVMASQLRPREVIMAYYRKPQGWAAACHVTDEERMLEIEKDCFPQYFAVDVTKLVDGFDPPLAPKELEHILRGETQRGGAEPGRCTRTAAPPVNAISVGRHASARVGEAKDKSCRD